MITPQGVVKVLDFGLAAVSQPSGESLGAANSPTLTEQVTQAGMIMGSAAYIVRSRPPESQWTSARTSGHSGLCFGRC